MRLLHALARVPAAGLRRLVGGITAALDALTGLVDRLSGRFDAHLAERTRLLRTHYDRRRPQAGPPPSLGGVAEDAALRATSGP